MKIKFYTILILCFMWNIAFAGVVSIDTYNPNDNVTDVTLNRNDTTFSNVLNGGLDNNNADTDNGFRFIEILSALPAAGIQGRVVFLTADNTLNFDTGSSFLATGLLGNTQTWTGNNTFTGTTSLTTVDISGGTISGGNIDGTIIGATTTAAGTFTALEATSTFKLGTTAQGEILYDNGTSIVRLGVGTTSGGTGQVLQTNAVGNPVWVNGMLLRSTTTFTGAAFTGNVDITAGNRYKLYFITTARSVDMTIFIQFDDDTTSTDYSWMNEEIDYSTTPSATLTGDNSDSEIEIGDFDGTNDGTTCIFDFDATQLSQGGTTDIGIFGQCYTFEAAGVFVDRRISGRYQDAGTLTHIEFYTSTGTFTGTVKLYEIL